MLPDFYYKLFYSTQCAVNYNGYQYNKQNIIGVKKPLRQLLPSGHGYNVKNNINNCINYYVLFFLSFLLPYPSSYILKITD